MMLPDTASRKGRPCSSCKHPKRDEIDRKLRAGVSFVDVSRWLAEQGSKIQPPAVGKHAREHVDVMPTRGRRPVSTDFLEAVRDAAHEGLADGTLAVTLKDGIAAQKGLDARLARDADRDLIVKIAMALTGNAGAPLSLPDPRDAAIEGEFRELLTSGAE
jgi:hypothetical protein